MAAQALKRGSDGRAVQAGRVGGRATARRRLKLAEAQQRASSSEEARLGRLGCSGSDATVNTAALERHEARADATARL